MRRKRTLLPFYFDRGGQVCTTITSAYFKLSQANVQIAYGSHSKPAVIEIGKKNGILQTGENGMRVPEEDGTDKA